MLRRRRVHVVFIAMSVCQQLAAAIERIDSIVNDSLTSSLTLFGYTSVKPVQLEAIHDLLSGKNVLVTVPSGDIPVETADGDRRRTEVVGVTIPG